MGGIRANGITLEFEEFGPRDAPALVLIRGLGTQLTGWPESFVRGLVEAGLRVIAHDNRDVGLSEKLTAAGCPSVVLAMKAAAEGRPIEAPYGLGDMAADTVGLLDALGIERAHFAGISMGGMIVQHLGFSHGDRVASLTSIMSSSGAPGLPPPRPEAAAALLSTPEDPSDRTSVIEHSAHVSRVLGSPGYPTPDEELRERAAIAYDRCHHPDGVARQLIAVTADVDRTEQLGRIRAPTLVIHGEDDPLVAIEGGRDTAARIPGARFQAIPGMGHDIPLGLVPTLVDLLVDHVQTAGADPGRSGATRPARRRS